LDESTKEVQESSKMRKKHLVSLVSLLSLLVVLLAACGNNSGNDGGTGNNPLGQPTATSQPTKAPTTQPTQAPTNPPTTNGAFKILKVELSVDPSTLPSNFKCGQNITFTYTALVTVAAGGPGGKVELFYTINNGRSQYPGSVTFAAGETTKKFIFFEGTNTPADHTQPGVAAVITTVPNEVRSNSLKPGGSCVP
jgi:hypothetical protein